MYLLTSPIHYVRKKRARRRQLQTVLHMLSASGVLRLGHVEPRYFVPSGSQTTTDGREHRHAIEGHLRVAEVAPGGPHHATVPPADRTIKYDPDPISKLLYLPVPSGMITPHSASHNEVERIRVSLFVPD